ncbi:alkaline phosphatase family protein [Litoribacter ruber]|uniref:alkaline phosphatase family protein n=1 Tax=Litoribacter ruber TaxID=702568 RepID=UPI001BD91AD7|nr:ectonucleotide pyrophosphatase/phosphodiesterase [Litoribacter ruber]MBT0810243.1 alkaline phosphatase family protein [Litoribacter ruber]
MQKTRLKVVLGLLLAFLSFTELFGQEKDPHVILISLDGFRYDYIERFKPKNLSEFVSGGVAAESLVPSFPSKTFPNHYTIATGLKPENHGLVDNTFYDPKQDQIYSIGNREVVQDKYWYGGTPLWVLAEKQGITAASYFFVGSEAPVQDIHPTFYYQYDGEVPNLQRISKVFEWLNMPDEERPRMITLYFSDMDDVGHIYGPNNDEKLQEKLNTLDAQLGALFQGVKSFGLNVNIILVSDHGMTDVTKDRLIPLDEIVKDLPVEVYNNGALAHVHLKNPKDKKKVGKALNKNKQNFIIADIEDKEYYKNIKKYRDLLGDFLILPDLGYYLAFPRDMMRYQQKASMFDTEVFGEHGYAPTHKDMHGIFYANGPAFKEGVKIESVENTDVYPLVAKILGLEITEEIDGKLENIQNALK